MGREKLNGAERLLVEAAWGAMKLFAWLPYLFKYYVVQELLYVVLRFVLRYRRRVVDDNLRNAFPEKSDAGRAAIRRGFYRTLAEVMVDTLDLASMNPRKARRRLGVKGLESHAAAVRGRDWIAMLAHYGCWEYCSLWGLYEPSQLVVGVYHPLRNRVMGTLFERLRNSSYAVAVPMDESLRFYLRNRERGVGGRNLVMGLIADQRPSRRPDSHWIDFLNQETIFYEGGGRLAERCGLPVYFVRMERTRRGCYEMAFDLIYDGKEPVAEYEITERYARNLEAMIRRRPELWMWSHRRWKHKRPHAER